MEIKERLELEEKIIDSEITSLGVQNYYHQKDGYFSRIIINNKEDIIKLLGGFDRFRHIKGPYLEPTPDGKHTITHIYVENMLNLDFIKKVLWEDSLNGIVRGIKQLYLLVYPHKDGLTYQWHIISGKRRFYLEK